MSRDEILALARQAGLAKQVFGVVYVNENAEEEHIVKFAELLQKALKGKS
jgi:hypothetical protein